MRRNQYTIYVTEEIAAKVIEVGFPCDPVYGKGGIDSTTTVSDIQNIFIYNDIPYYKPTAEEVRGWLRDRFNVDVYAVQVTNCTDKSYHYNIDQYYMKNGIWDLHIIETGETGSTTIDKVLLDGIDKVLELIRCGKVM